MNESELVEGQEYEGTFVHDGETVRGTMNHDKDNRNGRPSAGRVNLWDSSGCFAHHVSVASLRPVSGSTGAATREDADMGSVRDAQFLPPVQQADPERPTADDLAWAIRSETLVVEDKRRRHYEERCAAYSSVKASDLADSSAPHGSGVPSSACLMRHARRLDAAIARVKPAERDEPVYSNDAWPCDSEYEGQV